MPGSKAIDLVEETFGGWTVVRRDPEYPPGSGYVRWVCRCECGREVSVIAQSLQRGASTACFECGHASKREGSVTATLWSTIRWRAKQKGIPFSISKEYVWSLFLGQHGRCALSGVEITIEQTNRDHRRYRSTASLDRIDSLKGYTPKNVQWVHKDINRMKSTLLEGRFVELCRLVAERTADR